MNIAQDDEVETSMPRAPRALLSVFEVEAFVAFSPVRSAIELTWKENGAP